MAALNVGTTEAMQRQHASDADCFALPARSCTKALYSLHASECTEMTADEIAVWCLIQISKIISKP